MITYSFTTEKKEALYEQLYKMIRDDIISGRLVADTRLPSKRNLAEQLSISVVTVENAYSQLMSEGYIYSLPKKGFYVSDIIDEESPYYNQYIKMNQENAITNHNKGSKTLENFKSATVQTTPTDKLRLSNNESRATLSSIQGTFSHLDSPATKDEIFADFTSNATSPASFPFATWAKLNRRILSEEHDKLLTNPPSNGLAELRTAIASYLMDFRGIVANPDNIVIGAGTETMYSILIKLLGFDKVYACEDPGYEKLSLIFESNNVRYVKVPLDESGIIPEVLERENVNIVHTTPSHHFPTGITMPIKRRHELLSWANNGYYIIEDDYDSEFRLSGRPIPALVNIDTNERVIYMNTFTKSLASTIRISYMLLPDHLAKMYHKRLGFYSCPVSTFEQLTLAHFISEGYYEKHINRMRTASRKKRDLILKAIKTGPLNNISEIREEQSGLHFILSINTDKNDQQIIDECLQQGIRLSTIAPHSYMINYSSIPINKITAAIEILEKELIF